MAQYRVKDPQGQEHIINGPDNATPDEVMAQAKKIIPSQPSHDGTPLENAGQAISGAMEKINLGPGYGGPINTMQPQGDEIFSKAGGAIADYLGRKGVNPYVAAIPATAVSMANPQNWIGPKPTGIKGKAFEPIVPPERAFDIATAQKYNVPMTRADLTGSKAASMVETGLSNTITGSGPLQDVAKQKLDAIAAAREKIGQEFGTSQPPSSSGAESKLFMQREMGQAGATARDLYKQIPDVPISPDNFHKALHEIDFQNVDKGALSTINEIRSRLSSEPPITETTSPNVIGDTLQSQYRVGPTTPETPSIPTFQKLNDIRNLLSKEIQSDTHYNPILGNQIGEKAQALIPLKKALDADFKSYISESQATPYGKMESGQFETSFNKANKFYGDFKNLKSNKLVQKLSRVPESDIPKTVFGSRRIEDINVAKAVLGQDGFNSAKKQFFNDLLESKNIDTKLSKYKPEFLSGVFNEKELNALREASSISKTSTTAERMAGNPSGTARVVSSIATGGVLADALRKLFTNPVGAVAEGGLALGGPRLASKAYLATTHGIPYSASPVTTGASRAALIAAYLSRRNQNQ